MKVTSLTIHLKVLLAPYQLPLPAKKCFVHCEAASMPMQIRYFFILYHACFQCFKLVSTCSCSCKIDLLDNTEYKVLNMSQSHQKKVSMPTLLWFMIVSNYRLDRDLTPNKVSCQEILLRENDIACLKSKLLTTLLWPKLIVHQHRQI